MEFNYNQDKNERKYFTANDEWFCLNQCEIDMFMLVFGMVWYGLVWFGLYVWFVRFQISKYCFFLKWQRMRSLWWRRRRRRMEYENVYVCFRCVIWFIYPFSAVTISMFFHVGLCILLWQACVWNFHRNVLQMIRLLLLVGWVGFGFYRYGLKQEHIHFQFYCGIQISFRS